VPRAKRKKPLVNTAIDETLNRIAECEMVVNELENSPTWNILLKDIQAQKQSLDDNWQELTGEKLDKARVLKFATNHILTLKHSYAEELKARKEEVKAYQNPDKVIVKDYDTEGVNGAEET